MLEWMHDKDVVKDLRKDFGSRTIRDCEYFIRESNNIKESLHLAIVNDNDEYMGTVSLKHITEKTAEFGITIRSCAMGKGYSRFGMDAILAKGFIELGLKEIYWCVDPNNKRALRFYKKNTYQCCDAPQNANYSIEEKNYFVWFHVLSSGD